MIGQYLPDDLLEARIEYENDDGRIVLRGVFLWGAIGAALVMWRAIG